MDGMLSISVTAFKLLGESVMDSLMLKSYGSFLQENVNVSVVVRFSVALVKHQGHKQLWGRKGSLQPATLPDGITLYPSLKAGSWRQESMQSP